MHVPHWLFTVNWQFDSLIMLLFWHMFLPSLILYFFGPSVPFQLFSSLHFEYLINALAHLVSSGQLPSHIAMYETLDIWY